MTILGTAKPSVLGTEKPLVLGTRKPRLGDGGNPVRLSMTLLYILFPSNSDIEPF